MNYDYLIIGSGLYGATFAYLAHKSGKNCLVVERRAHTGGNVYCESVENINVHKYGAHIFHTNSKEVWDFVSSLVEFNRYTNSPLANYRGKLFNLPFNMNTFYQMWGVKTPDEARAKIEEQRKEVCIEAPANLEEQAVSLVGRDIYETLIKEYTEKQWGRSCRDLPAFIIKRLPVRFTFDNNYFDDAFQGVPKGGYNKLIDALLKGIEVRVNCDFFAHKDELVPLAARLVFTGRIDEYFSFCFSPLAYRSLRFEEELLPVQNWQGNAVINYTGADVPYTRVIEHKHFETESPAWERPITVISREYPAECTGDMEGFYPVNDAENSALYQKYKELADKESSVLFGGRLAEYKYYDMDDVIAKAIADFKKEERRQNAH